MVRSELRPHLVLAGGPEGSDVPPLLAGAAAVERPARRLRLRELRLPAPVTDPAELERELADLV